MLGKAVICIPASADTEPIFMYDVYKAIYVSGVGKDRATNCPFFSLPYRSSL